MKTKLTLKDVESMIFSTDSHTVLNVLDIRSSLCKEDREKLSDIDKTLKYRTTYTIDLTDALNIHIDNISIKGKYDLNKSKFVKPLYTCLNLYSYALSVKMYKKDKTALTNYFKHMYDVKVPSICAIAKTQHHVDCDFNNILSFYFCLITGKLPCMYFFSCDVDTKEFYEDRINFINHLLDIIYL